MSDAEPDAVDQVAADPARPTLRIISSDATPEEVAAVVAVLSALGGEEPTPSRRRPEWGAPHRAVRRSLPHGAGGWRASSLP